MHRRPDGSWDKSRLPSRHTTEGPARAPHRSYYYAMGLGTREIALPFVGVVHCGNESAPWKRMGVTLLVMVGAMTLSAFNEERKARQSQREIDALDSLSGS